MKINLLFSVLLISFSELFAQGSVPGYHDAAISRNRLIKEQQGEGVYKMIGTFKVVGTPYLFGEKKNANLYSTAERGSNIDISFNTYNQEVEFYSTANPNQSLVKLPGELDSFIIKQNVEAGILSNLKFVYAPLLGNKDKTYLQEVVAGDKFSFYKRYKSELGYVSSNYIQSELRQFDLVVDYYYYNAAKKSFKKIKLNYDSFIKEFKDVKDLKSVASNSAFNENPEAVIRKFFINLNL